MMLKDRVAIVTGAGSGIGRGIALALARAGARVAVVDISEMSAKGVVQEIQKERGTAEAYKADVTIKAKIDQAVDRLKHSEFSGQPSAINSFPPNPVVL